MFSIHQTQTGAAHSCHPVTLIRVFKVCVPELTCSCCLFSGAGADGFLVKNEASVKGALTCVESLVGGVSQLVGQGVSRCQERVRQQQALCLQEKEQMLQLLVRTRL